MHPFLAGIFLCAAVLAPSAMAAIAPTDHARPSAASLRAAYTAMRDRLEHSPFGNPLYLEAREDPRRVSGEAYAVLDHTFARARRTLADPAQWCEILLLPFNTKQCESAVADNALALTIFVGRKYTTPLAKTHRLDFSFRTPETTPDYLHVELVAPTGPFGTRAYRIEFELAPLDDRRSFLHFAYSYEYGFLARAAMQTYLSTVAANKVGFTTEGAGGGTGDAALVRGMRGVMERNTMRYYLAIAAYLEAQASVPERRTAAMVEGWFASVERYPRQLHELAHDEYVSMKLAEFERMHARVSLGRRTASSSP
jgi:hypothetical protein